MSFDTRGLFFVCKVIIGVVVLFFAAQFVSSYFGDFLFFEPLTSRLAQLSGASQSDLRVIPPYITPYKTIEGRFGRAPSDAPDKYIAADLEKMELTLYASGSPMETVPILSKGRRGTPWETPTGTYEVQTKEANHFSSMGHVWMPYSLQVYGNYFIHGWPYESDGTPVPRGYSGGCIRLSTEDAKKVYEFASLGTPVYVKEDDQAIEQSVSDDAIKIYPAPLPQASAASYLVVDMKTGAVLLEKNAQDTFPIASVTKLMTAIVGSESIFLERVATVSEEDVAVYGDSGSLVAGERFSLQQLLYPLLLESSNDAASTIASMIHGKKLFVKMMNDKAGALGMTHTSFADPAGIDEKNTSTPEDLFRLIKYIYDKRSFLFGITRQPHYQSASLGTEQVSAHDWANNNHFFANPAFVGGKVGHTTAARDTMVSVFNVDVSGHNRPIGIIVLGSDNRDQDIESLLAWVRSATHPPQDTPIRLGFVGDIMLNRAVEKKVLSEGGGDFRFPFLKIADTLAPYDLLFGNLEGPISDQGENVGSIYSFRMDPRVVDGLIYAGFDVLSVANNHMGDWTKRAMKDTFARLKKADIVPVGGGNTEAEAYAPHYVDVRGIRIGFVGFSEFGKGYLEGDAKTPGIAIAEKSRVVAGVAEARASADIVVASFHFGEEYRDNPTRFQQDMARAAIDAGADLVVGHHPHVLEPLEKYGSGYIKYSLGNFVFDQSFSEKTMTSEVLDITVQGKKIVDVKEIPLGINASFQPYPKK